MTAESNGAFLLKEKESFQLNQLLLLQTEPKLHARSAFPGCWSRNCPRRARSPFFWNRAGRGVELGRPACNNGDLLPIPWTGSALFSLLLP